MVLFTVGRDVTVVPSGVSPAANEWPHCRASENMPVQESVLH